MAGRPSGWTFLLTISDRKCRRETFESFSFKIFPLCALLKSREINDGDFKTISERFCSLCDWSIEAKCVDGNYRINFLRDKNIGVCINYKR